MTLKLDAIQSNQYALLFLACMGFTEHTPNKSFLVNNVTDTKCVAKNSRFVQSPLLMDFHEGVC